MAKGKDLKPHIGIFGRRNNGKSSFINRITGQEVAIVSDHPGTTTDPVRKSVEIFGIGPAIIIDTAGIDDAGELGKKRVEKTMNVIKTIDCAILLIAENIFDSFEIELIEAFKKYEVPFLIVHNKSDIKRVNIRKASRIKAITGKKVIDYSAINNRELETIIEELKSSIPEMAYIKPSLFEGLISPKDIVLLITPIDSEAPEGRMILPQQMAIRDVLDHDGICITIKETELEDFMEMGIRPALVVTDSQVFKFVASIIPDDIPLTGFSIVFAKNRANFEKYLEGTPALANLIDGDKVLILESCTHHISCEDIGRFKLPDWIKKFTKKQIEFEIVAGLDNIPGNLNDYALVVQCGGCVATQKQVKNRLLPAIEAGIPVTNYGMAIAFMNGIFKRAVAPFLKQEIAV
ncbi:MAG: [FeFe] hydrogenase H-cluster maturation GTPase HydF [Bacteroidetes bacterium]|nr:[FeFe] hydrogenase H-cluster maturation GTPase HydF [Bacteroidota bacterium]